MFSSPQAITKQQADEFGAELAGIIYDRLTEPSRRPGLSISKLGRCIRELWYEHHCPEKAAELPPKTRLKFLYGDIIESLVLFLAKLAKYEVTERQKKVEAFGVPGSIDGRLDGHLVDVKSAATRSLAKFAIPDGLLADDPFGYLPQLRGYGASSGDAVGSFIAVDKQHGDIVVAEYPLADPLLETKIEYIKHVLAQDQPPTRPYVPVVDRKTKRDKLPVKCVYCSFKETCWAGTGFV